MRIVIATPFYPPEKGVLGMYAQGLEGAFRAQGDDVVVRVFSRINAPPGLRHFIFFVQILIELRGASQILALDTWSVGLPSFFAAKLMRVPLSLRIGGDFVWESYAERTQKPIRLSEVYGDAHCFSWKERILFYGTRVIVRSASRLFFNAQFLLDLWHAAYGFNPKKACVIENRYPKRERGIQEPRGRVFVSAGRAITLKNYHVLERAFARVKKQYPDIELDRRSLSHAEHVERIAHSYAVIIPSLSEVASNTAIDAVIAGKPFVMTSDTGTSERLGNCGMFIDTRSEDALACALETLLNTEEYRRLQEVCAAFSFSHSWEDIAREMRATF